MQRARGFSFFRYSLALSLTFGVTTNLSAQTIEATFDHVTQVHHLGSTQPFTIERSFVSTQGAVAHLGNFGQSVALARRDSNFEPQIIARLGDLMPDESGQTSTERCVGYVSVMSFHDGRLLFKCSPGGNNPFTAYVNENGQTRRLLQGIVEHPSTYAHNSHYLAARSGRTVSRVSLLTGQINTFTLPQVTENVGAIRINTSGDIVIAGSSDLDPQILGAEGAMWWIGSSSSSPRLIYQRGLALPGYSSVIMAGEPVNPQFSGDGSIYASVSLLSSNSMASWSQTNAIVRFNPATNESAPVVVPVGTEFDSGAGEYLSAISNFKLAADGSVLVVGRVNRLSDPSYLATKNAMFSFRSATDGSRRIQLLMKSDQPLQDTLTSTLPNENLEFEYRETGRSPLSSLLNLNLRPSDIGFGMGGAFQIREMSLQKILVPGDSISGSPDQMVLSASSYTNGQGEILVEASTAPYRFPNYGLPNDSALLQLRADNALAPLNVGSDGRNYSLLASAISSDGRVILSTTWLDAGPSYALVNLRDSLRLCDADINSSGTLSSQDVFDFLAAWTGRTVTGDFNRDEIFSVQDLFDFLGRFLGGCGDFLMAPREEDLPTELREMVANYRISNQPKPNKPIQIKSFPTESLAISPKVKTSVKKKKTEKKVSPSKKTKKLTVKSKGARKK